VPLHITLNSKAICNILNHSEAKILIVSNAELLHKVLLCLDELLFLKKIICIENFFIEIKDSSIEILNWKKAEENLINSQLYGKTQSTKIDSNINDICSIIYTSGTTGEPKGVLLTHKNLLSNVESLNKAIPVKENDIFLSFLPLSHTLERMAGQMVPILFGATIAYAENAKTLVQNLKEVRPTILISVPRIFEKFHDKIWDKINQSSDIKKQIFKWSLKQKKGTIGYLCADYLAFKKVRNNLGGRLRLTISGGASLNLKLVKFFNKVGIIILEGYGLTETSPVISVNTENDICLGSVGKSLPEVLIKINKETKEVLVKGANVFSGYLNNKEETEKCFDSDNWFKTGDLGFISEKGFLTIIGRKKEMLITNGGKNVWPEPIENLLNDDRFVSQSMVIGNNKKFISALIVPDWQEVEIFIKQNNFQLQGHDKLVKNVEILKLFLQRLNEKINANLNDFEKIKAFVLLPQEFSQEQGELTPTLKLRRHIIELHYKKEIETLYQ
jgi:long-chain acyl-CoA synthetase